MKRIGIIGLGSISERHRKNIRQRFPQASIVVMSARGKTRALTSIENADVLVPTFEEMLNQHVQCIIVASPASSHHKHVKACLETGIPVLIEKPLAATLEDGLMLSRLAKSTLTQAAVGYCLRFLPSTDVVKKALQQRLLGHLYNINIEVGQYLPQWRPNTDYRHTVSAQKKLGGGALLELSHELDLAQWLLGPLTLQHAILRSASELETDVEDCADLMLLSHQQAVTHIHLDFLQRIPRRRWRIVGSLGVLEWDLIGNEVLMHSESTTEVLYSAPDWDKNQMYLRQFDDFIKPQQGTQRKIASVEEALTTLQIIDDIKRFPIHTIDN